MSNLSIRKKMTMASALLVLILLSQAIIINKGVGQIHQSIDDIASYDIQMLVLSKDIQFSIAQVQQWLTDISATRGLDGLNDGFDEASAHASKLREYMQRIKKLDPVNSQRYQNISSSFETYYQAGQTMAKAYIKDGPTGGNPLMGQFDSAAARLIEQIEPLLQQIDANSVSSLEQKKSQVDRLQLTSLISSLLIFAFLAVGFFALNSA